MKIHVVALDYDGTIAIDGHLDPAVGDALAEAQARGLALILATGRILAELLEIVGDVDMFAAIVAENGAHLYFPQQRRSRLLGEPWPAELVGTLRQRGVVVRTGRCVIEAAAHEAAAITAVIREQEWPLTVVFNRGRLMVLPQGVSKATGLHAVLRTLRLSEHNTIAIGDAENDHPLLAAAEIGVAVQWGSRPLKERADLILAGDGPPAVAAFIRNLTTDPHLTTYVSARRQLVLGTTASGDTLHLAVRGRNLLIAGDARSGKSWITGLIGEQLIIMGYSVCVIDPEGDYAPLESLPGVVRLISGTTPPPLDEILGALRHPDISVVLDLSALGPTEKRLAVSRLLPALSAVRRQRGLPHQVILDEAHYFLHTPDLETLLDLELAGYTLVTYRLSELHPGLLARCDAVIVTRLTDPHEVQAALIAGGCSPTEADAQRLATLDIGDAVLLCHATEPPSGLALFHVAGRLTDHIRHRSKYREFPVAERDAFWFTRDGRPTGQWARSLGELAHGIGLAVPEVLEGHLRRHDFSRWITDIYGDKALAIQIKGQEDRCGRQPLPGLRQRLISLLTNSGDPQDTARTPAAAPLVG